MYMFLYACICMDMCTYVYFSPLTKTPPTSLFFHNQLNATTVSLPSFCVWAVPETNGFVCEKSGGHSKSQRKGRDLYVGACYLSSLHRDYTAQAWHHIKRHDVEGHTSPHNSYCFFFRLLVWSRIVDSFLWSWFRTLFFSKFSRNLVMLCRKV